jgi:hypothetical protein
VAETSFPVAGGAGVTDATYERLMGPITGSGRYNFNPTASQITTPLIFADNSGRQVKAYANQSAIVRGFRWESGTTPPVISLDANTSGNPRLDLIVLRLDRSGYTVRLGKTKGTPAAVPSAPAAVQDTGTTGVYELPLATVKVASNGTTGQPFIQTTDVTDLDWWLSPPGTVTLQGQNPPVAPGALLHHADTGRSYRGVGSEWVLFGEVGAWTKISALASWTSDNIYAQRVNGMVYFQASVTAQVERASGTNVNICSLPEAFKPSHDFNAVAWMAPNQIGLVSVTASNGLVTVTSYGSALPSGGKLIIPPLTWPYV